MPGFATTPCDIAVMVIDPYLYKLYEDIKKIYLIIINMKLSNFSITFFISLTFYYKFLFNSVKNK